MKTKKQSQLAKALFKKSLTNNFLDDKKASSILKAIVSRKPQGLTSLLRAYKKLVEVQVMKETLIVESSTPISNKSLESQLLKRTGAKKIKFIANPQMVFGAKITNGDRVWEDSLETHLNQISQIN